MESAWLEDSRPCQFSYFSGVLARLAMRHTRVFGKGIPDDAYFTFQRCPFWPCLKFIHVYFTFGILLILTVLGLKILAHVGVLARLTMRHSRVFVNGIPHDAYLIF